MKSAAEAPIDATLIGTVPAVGSVETLSQGPARPQRDDDRLEIHGRETFLSGAPSPTRSLRLPPHAAAAALPDGGLVIAEGTRIPGTRPRQHHPPGIPARRLAQRRVEPPAAGRPGREPRRRAGQRRRSDARRRGDPGRSGLRRPPHHRYARDTLLLLDTVSGEVRARRPIGAVSSAMTQRWHPDGSLLALSCWTAWYSWSTWWIEPLHDGLHIRGGTTMREVIDFLPGVPRVLTLRRAEGMARRDGRDELASHDTDEPSRAARPRRTGRRPRQRRVRGRVPAGLRPCGHRPGVRPWAPDEGPSLAVRRDHSAPARPDPVPGSGRCGGDPAE